MSIAISHNGTDLIRLREWFVSGRKAAGGYGFVFVVKGHKPKQAIPMNIFNIQLSLSVMNSSVPIVPCTPSSIMLIECGEHPNDSEQLIFEVVFTKEQINSLEEYRQERDLKLYVGMRALTSSGESLLSSYEATEIVIPREQWLTALKTSRFRQTLLFEVPIPELNTELEALIGKAQEFIEVGHYNEAVGKCRLIIEQIEKIRGDKKQSSESNTKAHGKERQDMTSIERMLSLREQLKNKCQLGVHGSEGFTRSQARSVLAMTLALLSEPTVGFFESKSEQDVE